MIGLTCAQPAPCSFHAAFVLCPWAPTLARVLCQCSYGFTIYTYIKLAFAQLSLPVPTGSGARSACAAQGEADIAGALAGRSWDRPAALTVELVADGSAAVMRPPVEAAIAAATAPVDAAVAGASGLPRLDANPSAGPGNRPPHAGQRARYPNMNPNPKAAPPPPLAPAMPAGDPAVASAKAAVAAAVTAGRSTLSEETCITDQGYEPACQVSKGEDMS